MSYNLYYAIFGNGSGNVSCYDNAAMIPCRYGNGGSISSVGGARTLPGPIRQGAACGGTLPGPTVSGSRWSERRGSEKWGSVLRALYIRILRHLKPPAGGSRKRAWG